MHRGGFPVQTGDDRYANGVGDVDKEQSLALYNKGRDTWNNWANDLLKRHSDDKWLEDAAANFAGHTFESDADFRDFVFPNVALFDGATFDHHADFSKAIFHGCASFERVKFKFGAGFREATFKDKAWFSEVKFEDDDGIGHAAVFQQAVFEGDAWFWKAVFGGESNFWEAIFHGHAEFGRTTHRIRANFLAVQGKSAFMMERVIFHEVPDFTQATFVRSAPTGRY